MKTSKFQDHNRKKIVQNLDLNYDTQYKYCFISYRLLDFFIYVINKKFNESINWTN